MNILYVNACARENSRTDMLALYAIGKLDGTVNTVNLTDENIQPLDRERLKLRDSLITGKQFDHPIFRYAQEFAKADTIVIAAPYWDLSFPAMLKIYIEAVNVTGITFEYTQEGYPRSLCRAKKLIYITTAGGPILSDEPGFGYIKLLATGFYGIQDIKYIKAENLDIFGADVNRILNDAKAEIDSKI